MAGKVPARLLGIAFSRLESPEATAQLSLLGQDPSPVETERDKAVSRTVDRINAKFGRNAVRPARLTRPARRER